ncbi:transcriptional regulator [Bacillus cereus]|uniref:Transcriptional regulator n=2 Tax=Bacillus cereus group TaxID=86661 RepID=A0A9X6VH06_BACCE|nr:transcriptional regulator [Bacillus cereus]PFC11905.1 transcriptional regulator [Bacillus cereus]PFD17317.1 transcriptional regulator [Bacillus cereus]PFL62295.1 transcriptional regulator [Bacillus cereus]PGW57374.1 transcriptional regulator [Bacillus cereus]
MKRWNDKTKVICTIVGISFRVFYIKKGEFSFYITVWK